MLYFELEETKYEQKINMNSLVCYLGNFDSLGHYSLLLTPAEKVENLNSWNKFLFVVFTPQTSSYGPERWVGSTMKTMFHQRNCEKHR